MSTPEYEATTGSLWERGSRTTEMGTIREVVRWLFPEVHKETGTALEAFFQTLGSTLPTVDNGNGVIVVRGSAGHRIVNRSLTGDEKPSGFDTMGRVWKGLIEDSRFGLEDCEEANILADRKPDMDLVIDISVDLDRVAEAAQKLLGSNVRIFTYAHVPILEAKIGRVTFEMHHLPDTIQLAEDDHRVSMSLPVCEAFSTAFMRPDGSVYVDTFSQAMLSNDRVSTSFGSVHRTQAIVSAQRALCTHHIYQYAPVPELADEYASIGQSLSHYISNPEFWERARERTPSSTVAQRQTEMTFGFMKLLTQDPSLLARHRPLFNQTLIGPLLKPDYTIYHDKRAYQQAFIDGTLEPDESGLALLATQLDMPILEVIRGLRVSE